MIKAEHNKKGYHDTYPWFPELHDALRLVYIRKANLNQNRTKLSHQSQIKFLTKFMQSPIDVSCKHPAEIKKSLRLATTELKKIRKKAKELRKIHLSKRAWTTNIANKSLSEKNNNQHPKDRTGNINLEENQISNKWYRTNKSKNNRYPNL